MLWYIITVFKRGLDNKEEYIIIEGWIRTEGRKYFQTMVTLKGFFMLLIKFGNYINLLATFILRGCTSDVDVTVL